MDPDCHLCGDTGTFSLQAAEWDPETGRMGIYRIEAGLPVPIISGPFRCRHSTVEEDQP